MTCFVRNHPLSFSLPLDDDGVSSPDIFISCKNSRFPAHRILLGSCSQFLNSLIPNVPQCCSSTISLPPEYAPVLPYFLELVYTGRVSLLNEDSRDRLQELLRLLHISIDNECDYSIGDQSSDEVEASFISSPYKGQCKIIVEETDDEDLGDKESEHLRERSPGVSDSNDSFASCHEESVDDNIILNLAKLSIQPQSNVTKVSFSSGYEEIKDLNSSGIFPQSEENYEEFVSGLSESIPISPSVIVTDIINELVLDIQVNDSRSKCEELKIKALNKTCYVKIEKLNTDGLNIDYVGEAESVESDGAIEFTYEEVSFIEVSNNDSGEESEDESEEESEDNTSDVSSSETDSSDEDFICSGASGHSSDEETPSTNIVPVIKVKSEPKFIKDLHDLSGQSATSTGCGCKGACIRNCPCRTAGTSCTPACKCIPRKCRMRVMTMAAGEAVQPEEKPDLAVLSLGPSCAADLAPPQPTSLTLSPGDGNTPTTHSNVLNKRQKKKLFSEKQFGPQELE